MAFAIFFDAQRPEDGALAEAMRRAGNVIVPVVAQGAKAFDPRPGVAQEFEAFVRPASTVRSAAVDEGLANVTTGRDSVVRSLPLLLRARGEELPEPGAHDRGPLHPATGRPGRARGSRPRPRGRPGDPGRRARHDADRLPRPAVRAGRRRALPHPLVRGRARGALRSRAGPRPHRAAGPDHPGRGRARHPDHRRHADVGRRDPGQRGRDRAVPALPRARGAAPSPRS